MSKPLIHPVSVPASSTPTSPAKGRPALKLVKTASLNRGEWLEVRKGGIGSSDAAAAVGLHPYKSQLQLWMEKTGRDGQLPVVDPQDDSSPMYWGTLLEPIVAAHYTRRTGHKVRRVNAVLQHPEHPWMLANIDREVTGAADVQILECKTAGIHGARLWRDGVPEYVQLQVMHQLAVTGKGCDTFGPTGPWLVTADEIPDPHNLDMWLEVDGKRYQSGNTRTMIFNVPKIVSYLSNFMTLQPGDVISTGTPPGVGMGIKPVPVFLHPGQTMRLGIQGLGEQCQRTISA